MANAKLAGWCLLVAVVLMLGLGSGSTEAAETALPRPSAGAPSYRLDDYRLLAISPAEGVAVLRDPAKRLVTLRVGMVLEPARARLKQVIAGRLRFETLGAKGATESVWMIAAAKPELPPELQRSTPQAPPATSGLVVPPVNLPPPSIGVPKKQP